MLRRKPTALTISPEDVQAFEDTINRRIAYAHYKQTGEDPNGYFTGANAQQSRQQQQQHQQQQQQIRQFGTPSRRSGQGQAVDPSDELKPLPGDRARIVRSREERIVGGASTNSGR